MGPVTRDSHVETGPSMAREVARAAAEFEQQRTGQAPRSVAVVLAGDTLVITVHGALSPAERDLARSPAGAAQVQEFHRQLFLSSCGPLRQQIERITGVPVREAAADVEADGGTLVRVFSSGTAVQVFLLGGHVAADSWSEHGPGGPERVGTVPARGAGPAP